MISICIPSYNGKNHLSSLLGSIFASPSFAFEVIVSDDFSSDGTWEMLENFATSETRLKIYQNSINLGMDVNFSLAASYASGEYIWFFGQDDKILPGGIEHLSKILERHKPGFVLMNYVYWDEASNQPSLITGIELNRETQGRSLEGFLAATDSKLPSFLPSYVIRRDLWNFDASKKYFGTNYVQVGMFLEVIQGMSWLVVPEVFIIGLVPISGWQNNLDKYHKIIIGYFLMLHRASKTKKGLARGFVVEQYLQHIEILSDALQRANKADISLSTELRAELIAALKIMPISCWRVKMLARAPKFYNSILAIEFKLRKLIKYALTVANRFICL